MPQVILCALLCIFTNNIIHVSIKNATSCKQLQTVTVSNNSSDARNEHVIDLHNNANVKELDVRRKRQQLLCIRRNIQFKYLETYCPSRKDGMLKVQHLDYLYIGRNNLKSLFII